MTAIAAVSNFRRKGPILMSAVLFVAAMALAAPQMSPNGNVQVFRVTPTIDHSTAAALLIHVDQHGKVVACSVQDFVGTSEDAERFCSKVKKVRLRPAVGPDGSPANALTRIMLKQWEGHASINDDVRRLDLQPNIIRKAADSAHGASGYTDVGVSLWVAADGSVGACVPVADDASKPLADTACEQATSMTFEPETVFGDPARPYVRSLTIRFERTAD